MNPFSYSAEKIASLIRGRCEGNGPRDTIIRHLLTDSRRIINAESSLFFAIKGSHRNGHDFIKDLYGKGVRCFVVSDKNRAESVPEDAFFIIVDDTLHALQELAACHRRNYAIPVIGITGSNGKTIVKEWLYQLLREDHNIVRSPKSYNSQIGVPLSVWQIKADNDLGIFEAGISHPGEMTHLEAIIKPTMGIFTNIGEAHAENFPSLQEKVSEKLHLFNKADTLIYCRDYLAIHDAVNSANKLRKNIKTFVWSRKGKADLQVARIEKSTVDTDIQAIYRNSFHNIRIPFTDDASIENAIQCWALMLVMGYESETIADRMLYLSPVAMRLEMKEGINNCAIINDSYNSDIGSLTIALDFLSQQKQHPHRTLILSDILQSGKKDASLYSEVAQLLKQKQVDRLIGIGEHISTQKELFELDKEFYQDTDDFLDNYHSSKFKDETILVKGARTFGFERISKIMQQKAHETVLEINLNALINNLNFYRSRLNSETKVMAMVKAFSYGSGSHEIANTLQFHNVDYMAVAYADEGVELRKAGITSPIMVMNPEEQSFDSMINFRLEPEIYSFRTLQLFSEAALRNLPKGSSERIPIHIKLDTGMHRLGFLEEDINELVIRIKNLKQLRVDSVFSHLAGSDEPKHDEFTREQCELFIRMSDKICEHFNRKILRHVLNSAGVMRFPEYQFDMVRLGIGLHGVAFTPHEQAQLEFVSSLKTSISQIKHIRKGNTIGYSRNSTAGRDMNIATVSVGYADGLDRRLGNGTGKMMVRGRPCPIIGNVCMDMCMIDVSDTDAREGDEVVVFGKDYSVMDMSRDLGTIPYEVLSTVSQRVKRIYYQE